ncbi:hypothetical protein BD770DRAFT_379538 [Pilaira anomala]|nr:hypothetical protein BD770DRAFT_379538 [Pilaira anomala]
MVFFRAYIISQRRYTLNTSGEDAHTYFFVHHIFSRTIFNPKSKYIRSYITIFH